MKIQLLFLILTIHHGVTCFQRDYTKRLYYTIKTTDPLPIATSLNARYEGQVGELSQYHWISIPITSSFTHLQKRDLQIQAQLPSRRLYKRLPPPIVENTQEEYKLNNETPPLLLPSLSDPDGFQRIKTLLNISDPGFDQQWHLLNRNEVGHDINVTGVWSQGITGKSVVIAILDDGLDMDHPDLKDNYVSLPQIHRRILAN